MLTTGTKITSEIIFTLSAETEAEVKEWAEKVKNAGDTNCRYILSASDAFE